MLPTPIITESDYEAALKRFSELFYAKPKIGTAEGNELEILAVMIDQYEKNNSSDNNFLS